MKALACLGLALLLAACTSPPRLRDGDVVERPYQDVYRCILEPESPLCPRPPPR